MAELADAAGLGPAGRKPLEVRLLSPALVAAGSHAVRTIRPVSEFPFLWRERVRFRDCDAMGHVNNAVFSTYLEQARIGVLGGLAEFILARVEIDFRSELRAGEEVEIRSRCGRIGRKSFDLEHELRADGRVVAEAKSVLVAYDYATGASVPLSHELKARLRSAQAASAAS